MSKPSDIAERIAEMGAHSILDYEFLCTLFEARVDELEREIAWSRVSSAGCELIPWGSTQVMQFDWSVPVVSEFVQLHETLGIVLHRQHVPAGHKLLLLADPKLHYYWRAWTGPTLEDA